jgi:UDP-glucose 4-epimerase
LDIRGKKILVIGGAGLIGSHIVEELLKEEVNEVIIYDNFFRGTYENLSEALRDERYRIFQIGGDILETDMLHTPMKDVHGVLSICPLCGSSSALNSRERPLM